MAIDLSDEQWKAIDEWILQGSIINGIRAIRECAGVGIRAAIEIYQDRYAMLRESRPEEFVCGPEEYWSGFYS